MSAQDRYTRIIESLVNGDEAKASELLHEAFVEKACEIWSDLVEQDELVEDDIAEEDLDEELDESFFDDSDEEELQDEADAEMYTAEDEDEEMDDMPEIDAADELGGDDMDFDADGELDSHEEEHGDIEDKLVSVEDALADLKAEFARLMGDEEGEEDMGGEMDFGGEEEFGDEEEGEFDDEDEVEESMFEEASLKKVGKESAVHPVEMPNGEDGKPSVARQKPAAYDGDLLTIGGGNEKGGKVKAPAKMSGFKHPGEGAKLEKQAKGHGAEKKGSKPEAVKGDSMINKAPGPKSGPRK